MKLMYFRPGDKSKMLVRFQFGFEDCQSGVLLTYPLPDYTWRYAIGKYHSFSLPISLQNKLFQEVIDIRKNHPNECLDTDDLYNDASEPTNGITRDRKTHTACYSIILIEGDGSFVDYYSLKEDSDVLINSLLFKTVKATLAPYEHIDLQFKKVQKIKLP